MKFILKVLGIVLLILAATVGGSAVRIREFFKSPNILPLPNAAERKAERRAVKSDSNNNTLAVSEENEDEEADVVVEDDYSSHDEVEDEVEDPNDEDITEENYSTMMDLGSEDPEDEAAGLIDFSDE